MEFSTFYRMIETARNHKDRIDALYDLGVDIEFNTSADLWNPFVWALQEIYPHSANDIPYYFWETDFGRKARDCKDEFGRAIDFSDIGAAYRYFERREWYMNYIAEPYGKDDILAYGCYYNLDFWIFYNGHALCAYIDATDTNITSYMVDGIGVHGGVSWDDDYLPFLNGDCDFKEHFIGWDYAHGYDYQPEYVLEGKRWTTYEVAMQIKQLIERLVK